MRESTTLGRSEQRARRGRKQSPNNFYTSHRRGKKQKSLQGRQCWKEGRGGEGQSWNRVDLGQLSANTTVIIVVVVVVAVSKRNQLIDKRAFDEVLQGGGEQRGGGAGGETS